METPPYYSSVNPLWQEGRAWGISEERQRIIALLIELNAIRRDALGSLVAFNTYGDEVIYLPGLEDDNS